MDELEARYSDDAQYTIDLNGKRYHLNEEWRTSIQERAEREYAENEMFSCWWRVANESDAADSDTVHEKGDPILVIETEGPIVPWERLDQLELEMQDNSAFDGFDDSSDNGNGVKMIDPDSVEDDSDEEKNRTHFSVTPQDFQEVPTPDGEDPDKIPPKPQEFDEPSMVMWVPDNPDITHSWATGEAIAPMYNWVEWNVQQKAEQPRPISEESDSHNHFESLAQMHECEKVGELRANQETPSDSTQEPSGSVERKGKQSFEDGKYGGGHWTV
jgi:hypothetical protein